MLFFYKPLGKHKIENLDIYNRYFFYNLFTYEPKEFIEPLLIHSNFEDIYKAHKKIRNSLQSIHTEYMKLNRQERQTVKIAFQNNREISKICDLSIDPIKYDDLSEQFSEELETYLTGLWTLLTNRDPDKYSKIKRECGNIYEHYYDLFNDRQNFTVCPACGIEELLTEYDAAIEDDSDRSDREAYDHFFPKTEYPFTSILFSNLVPICGRCNGRSCKGTYDTAYNGILRQKTYYPFSQREDSGIQVVIHSADITKNLKDHDDWSISIVEDNDASEEVASWIRMFKINSRYKARIKQKEKAWKEPLWAKYNEAKKSASFDLQEFKSSVYKNISLRDQSSAIVQKAYYDYFLSVLVPLNNKFEEE